jgi:hypothetical protein
MVATENHKLSAFAAQVVIVSLSASSLQDLLRFDPDTNSADSIGSIWFKSSRLSNALATMFRVPQHLSIPTAKLDPTIVFLNMGAAASTICVHRFAKFQAGGDVVAGEVMQQSKIKCLEAASTILQLMKMTSHWDLNSVSAPALDSTILGRLTRKLVPSMHILLFMHCSPHIRRVFYNVT